MTTDGKSPTFTTKIYTHAMIHSIKIMMTEKMVVGILLEIIEIGTMIRTEILPLAQESLW